MSIDCLVSLGMSINNHLPSVKKKVSLKIDMVPTSVKLTFKSKGEQKLKDKKQQFHIMLLYKNAIKG